MKKTDSIYRVLSELQEFIKDRNISLKDSIIDEKALYAEAMEGVHKIPNNKASIKRHPVTRANWLSLEDNPGYLLEKAVADKRTLNVTNMPEYMEGYTEGIHPVTLDKLRNGEFSVQKILDLHGHSIDDAKTSFEAFITDSIKSGLNCVKVVHGRGLKSKRAPVLKENLKVWLIRAMNRKWVVAFSSARMCDGGPGATYILLKKKPFKRRIHIIG